MDKSHRTGARIRPRSGAMRAQVTLDLVQEDAQGSIQGFAVMVEVIAQPLGQGQDPLAHRPRGQDMIDKVCQYRPKMSPFQRFEMSGFQRFQLG